MFLDFWFFAYLSECNFVDAPVFSFSRKTKYFVIIYSRGCKFEDEG